MKKHISRRLLSLLLLLATVAVSVPFMGVTASAAAPATYTDIAVDEAKYVSVNGGYKYFRFIPERGGTYENAPLRKIRSPTASCWRMSRWASAAAKVAAVESLLSGVEP